MTKGSHNCTIDLTDFTFLFPIRIDSRYRKENTDASVKYILEHFKTNIIILEGDISRKYYLNHRHKDISYEFLKDKSKFFHKTRYINRLIEIAKTPFIVVWDADVIVPGEQVLNSIEAIRSGKTVFSIPYDGRVYKCDELLSNVFKRTLRIEILEKLMSALPLMYGYHSPGGAFITDKEKYIRIGGENLNFKSWGPEDMERIKRFEVLNIPVHRSGGPMFHLWHHQRQNSWYANSDEEIWNRRELIRTCQKT
jgi:predicted glycosyltransferase involved in capsule biosynthesis